MSNEIKLPSAEHPITIESAPTRVVAKVESSVIADTQSALILQEASYPPVHYIPLKDVDQAMLRPSDTVSHCPYKGDASYYTIVLPESELIDAVWSYEKPHPAVAAIAGHVAFYTDRVTVASIDK